MIYVKYFGAMAAELGTRIETLPWSEGGDTVELVRLLRSRNDRWNNALAENKIYKIVVQNEICHQVTIIPDGAEVAILPPVTGG